MFRHWRGGLGGYWLYAAAVVGAICCISFASEAAFSNGNPALTKQANVQVSQERSDRIFSIVSGEQIILSVDVVGGQDSSEATSAL
jgi:hypothetical protein